MPKSTADGSKTRETEHKNLNSGIPTPLRHLQAKNCPGKRNQSVAPGQKRKRAPPKRYDHIEIKDQVFKEPKKKIKRTIKVNKTVEKEKPEYYSLEGLDKNANMMWLFKPYPLKKSFLIKRPSNKTWYKVIWILDHIQAKFTFKLDLCLKQNKNFLKSSRRVKDLIEDYESEYCFKAYDWGDSFIQIGWLLPNNFESFVKLNEAASVYDKSKMSYFSWYHSITEDNRVKRQFFSLAKVKNLWHQVLNNLIATKFHTQVSDIFKTQYCNCQIEQQCYYLPDSNYETIKSDVAEEFLQESYRHSFRKTLYLNMFGILLGSTTFCIRFLKFRSSFVISIEVLNIMATSSLPKIVEDVISILIDTLKTVANELNKEFNKMKVCLVFPRTCYCNENENISIKLLKKLGFKQQKEITKDVNKRFKNKGNLKFLLDYFIHFGYFYSHTFYNQDSEAFYYLTLAENQERNTSISRCFGNVMKFVERQPSLVAEQLFIDSQLQYDLPSDFDSISKRKVVASSGEKIKLIPRVEGWRVVSEQERIKLFQLKDEPDVVNLCTEDTVGDKENKHKASSSGNVEKKVSKRTATNTKKQKTSKLGSSYHVNQNDGRNDFNSKSMKRQKPSKTVPRYQSYDDSQQKKQKQRNDWSLAITLGLKKRKELNGYRIVDKFTRKDKEKGHHNTFLRIKSKSKTEGFTTAVSSPKASDSKTKRKWGVYHFKPYSKTKPKMEEHLVVTKEEDVFSTPRCSPKETKKKFKYLKQATKPKRVPMKSSREKANSQTQRKIQQDIRKEARGLTGKAQTSYAEKFSISENKNIPKIEGQVYNLEDYFRQTTKHPKFPIKERLIERTNNFETVDLT